MAAVVRAAEIAHESGVKVVLNPAPATKLPEELLRCVSIIVPNESEASMLTGIDVVGKESAIEAARKFKSEGVGNVIITLGAKGSIVYDNAAELIPARRVEAVDTTAAGDTFCGALSVALSEGKSLQEAAIFATAASSLSVQKQGAQDSIPTREETDSVLILNRQNNNTQYHENQTFCCIAAHCGCSDRMQGRLSGTGTGGTDSEICCHAFRKQFNPGNRRYDRGTRLLSRGRLYM